MTTHINFYENMGEAQMRLRNTVVMYDGQPYFVLAITDHKKDGIFRVYMDEIGYPPNLPRPMTPVDNYAPTSPDLGPVMDSWLEQNKGTKVIRKQMNSPLFNKFRPYPLGMCNYERNMGRETWAGTIYIERTPQRRTEQGLTRQSVHTYSVSSGNLTGNPKSGLEVDIFSPSMKACILGDHPSAQDCLSNLLDDKIANEAVAFHRLFAFVRGPLDMIFLAYKQDIIGVLPKNDLNYVRLGKRFTQCREVVAELNLFGSIAD